MIKWHDAQKETPPAGKALLLNWIDSKGYDQIDRGFYAKSGTKEHDFDHSCLETVTVLDFVWQLNRQGK